MEQLTTEYPHGEGRPARHHFAPEVIWSYARHMNPRLLLSGAPIVVFWVASRLLDPVPANILGFSAFVLVYVTNRRDGLIGLLTAFGFVIVAVSAVFGIIFESEKAYLASGPVSDFLFIPLHLGSIAVGKPLIGAITRELFPELGQRVPLNHPVFVAFTLVWAVYDVGLGIARTLLLQELSVGEYLVWSRVLGWPASTVLIAITGYFVFREAARSDARRMESLPA